MTPDAAGIEAALAAGLAAHRAIPLVESGGIHIGYGCPAPCSWGNEGGHDLSAHRAHQAAALLPVVTQAQADERERVAQAIEAHELAAPLDGLDCTIELDVFNTPREQIEALADALGRFIYDNGHEAGVSASFGDSADPFAQGMLRAARIARAGES